MVDHNFFFFHFDACATNLLYLYNWERRAHPHVHVHVFVNNGSTSSTNQQVKSGRQLVTITLLLQGYHLPCVTAQAKSTTSHLTVGPTTCTTQASIGVQCQGQKQVVDNKLDKVFLKAAYKEKQKTFTLHSVAIE